MGKRSADKDDRVPLAKRSRKKPRNHDSLRAEKSMEEKKAIREKRKERKLKQKQKLASMPASSAALKEPAHSKISKIQLTAAINQSNIIKGLAAVATSTPITNRATASVKSDKQEAAGSSKIPDNPTSESSSSDDETPEKVKSSVPSDGIDSDNINMEDEQDYFSDKSDSDSNKKSDSDSNKKSDSDSNKKSDSDSNKKSHSDKSNEKTDSEKSNEKTDSEKSNEKTDSEKSNEKTDSEKSNEKTGNDGNENSGEDISDNEQDDDGEESSSSDESTEGKRPPKLSRQQHLAQLLHNKDDDGVIELMPDTGIYVDEDAFEMVVARKANHTGLVRNLLPLVFTNEALVNCSIKGQSQRGPLGATERSRPGLYPEALEVLLKKARAICRRNEVKRADPSYVIKQMNTKLSELRAENKKREEFKHHLEKKKNKKAKKDKSQKST